jgi:hypothetical protein
MVQRRRGPSAIQPVRCTMAHRQEQLNGRRLIARHAPERPPGRDNR